MKTGTRGRDSVRVPGFRRRPFYLPRCAEAFSHFTTRDDITLTSIKEKPEQPHAAHILVLTFRCLYSRNWEVKREMNVVIGTDFVSSSVRL